MAEQQDDISNLSAAHKWLLVAALSAGAGNGVLGLNKDTSDRYKAQTAAADFALRDSEIKHNAESTRALRAEFERTAHPPARIDATLIDHEKRVRALERDFLVNHHRERGAEGMK